MKSQIKKPSAKSLIDHKSVVTRLNRIEGQIGGIKKMLENDAYCDDILNQIEASRSALHSVQIILLESHLKNCVIDQLKNGDTDVIEEVLKTFKNLTK